MAWTLEGAKARYGIPLADTTQDALLTQQMSGAVAIADKYTNRNLLFKANDSYVFEQVDGYTVQVKRFPIDVTPPPTVGMNGSALTAYRIDYNLGLFYLTSGVAEAYASLTWSGGYRTDGSVGGTPMPYDLELALYSILDSVRNMTSTVNVGSGVTGDITSVTIPDVGTIRYNEHGEKGATGVESSFADAYSLLDPYVLWGV